MRILVFTDSFYPELGGIQDSLAVTSRELGARGHTVLLCAPTAADRDYAISGLPVHEIDLGGNVTVRRMFSLPTPSSTRQSRLLLPTLQRWREMAHFGPDLVHAHTFLGAGWEAVRTARRLRVPLIGTNHWAVGEFGVYFPVSAQFFARATIGAVTRFYNQCDQVTAPSRSVLREMCAFGLRKPHCVVSNPIDTSSFAPAPPPERERLKRSLGFSPATILYAGRLAVEKNIDILIRALALLAGRNPDVMLALAGHGTARPGLEALAREQGVASQVRFLGTLGTAELGDACRAADVFATASTSETQCMALLQGMSAGLPAVGADWRALREYIPADAGFLADPHQPNDFATKLDVLLRDLPLRYGMGEQAARFAEHFSVARVADDWERLYASVVADASLSLRDTA